MSQQQVCKFLQRKKNKGKWLTTTEIKKQLNLKSASNNLRKLHKFGEVEKRQTRLMGRIIVMEWRIL